MNTQCLFYFFSLVFLSSCGHSDSKNNSFGLIEADSVNYYYGPVSYSQGGETYSLIKRTISPSRSQIIEELIQPPRVEGQAAFSDVTTMTRVGTSNEFAVTDSLKSFQGKISFQGPEWKWTSWTYQIEGVSGLMNGMTILGSAKLDSNDLHIEKVATGQYRLPDGSVKAFSLTITEAEKEVSSSQYEACRQKLSRSTSIHERCEEI